jgi:hypothetical protein
MKLSLNNKIKIGLVIFCFIASVIGFLAKLPSAFRHIDKELHFIYYFLAAAFLNILFNVKNLFKHLLIAFILFLFGVMIEFAQENYNKIFHVHFHGRFDPQDLKADVTGIIAFSILWAIFILITFSLKSTNKSSQN